MIVTTRDQLDEVVEHLLQRDSFAFDVETVGDHALDPRRNEVTWISLATQGMGCAIPMGHPNGRLLEVIPGRTPTGKVSKNQKLATKVWSKPPAQLRPAEVFSALKPLLMSDRTKVGHNIKFDACSVAKYLGELPPAPFADTHVAAYLIKSTHRMVKGFPKPYALGAVVNRELGYAYDKTIGAKINDHGFWEVAKYSHLDARMDWLVWKELKQQLQRDKLTGLFRLEMDLLAVLCEMEMTGAPVDKVALEELWDDLTDEVERRKGVCFSALGRTDINLGSPQQLVQVLFAPKETGGLGLKPRKMTAGGKDGTKKQPSTDDEALEPYRNKVPFVKALLEYRETTKLLSTYVEPYLLGPVKQGKRFPPQMVNGRIHTSFNQMGAETGRFSSSDPNLQNVPAPYTEEGKKIRGLFVAPSSEDVLVAGDYSQIEPRVLASLSGEPAMMDPYLKDEGDFYTAIAAPFGLDRKAGKVLFLSVAYGVGPDALAARIGISPTRARQVLDDFDRQFPVAARYRRSVINEARRRRPCHVTTLMGRKRYLPELASIDRGARGRAERQAFNTVIQGTAADLIKLSMVKTHRALADKVPAARLILTVHDELVATSPRKEADLALEVMREAMEGINKLRVPLVVDIKIVDRWSEAK